MFRSFFVAFFLVVWSFTAAFAQLPALPKGVTVTITKKGVEPASVLVTSANKPVRFAEGEWDRVPEDVRPYIVAVFGRKQPASIRIGTNCSEAPDAEAWSRDAVRTAEAEFPRLVALLDDLGFEPAKEATLVFKKMDGVAHASGTTITISANWIAKHPDDLGMVVHELVHVVQAYRRPVPGWVTEGIADYLRFFVFENNGDRTCRVNPDRAKHTDSYRTTAAFFDWIVKNRNPNFITELNAVCRRSGLPGDKVDETFEKLAGDKPEKLWGDFIESVRAKNKER